MVRETSVIKLSAIMRGLDVIYPDLKDWDKQAKEYYGMEPFDDEIAKKKWLGTRAKEIEKTTDAIVSFIEMDISNDEYLKKLIMYYLVLMDAVKLNLNFKVAYDDIFNEPVIGETV